MFLILISKSLVRGTEAVKFNINNFFFFPLRDLRWSSSSVEECSEQCSKWMHIYSFQLCCMSSIHDAAQLIKDRVMLVGLSGSIIAK